MAQDITFVLKARNEAQRAIRALGGDFEKVSAEVERLERDTEEAAKATGTLGKEARDASKNAQELATQTGEVAKQAGLAQRAWSGLKTVIGTVVAALGGLAAAVGPTVLTALFPAFLPARIALIARNILLLGTALAGLGAFVGLASSARDFNAALAETSTLIEGTPAQLNELTEASRALVREFGGNKTQQVEAFYQAISAGAASLPDAAEIVEQANRLAIGGVTDVTTGVDILTTAVNAYGPSTLSAAEASDALFVAMRGGKTTIEELASELGGVIPLATSTGVSFDELNAATAALTTQGISTNVAITQLRGILQGVIKPSGEAVEAAKRLGIEFNVAALQSKGLRGFLEDVAEATGGNAEELSKLFGSVEALGGALALTGNGADTFAELLEDMADKAGATDEAFEKVAQNLDQRLNVATSSIAETFERLGQVALRIVVPAVEALAAVLEVVADNADFLLIALGGLAARGFIRLVQSIGPARAALSAFFTTISTGGGVMAAFQAATTAFTTGTLVALHRGLIAATGAMRGFLTSIGLGGVATAFSTALSTIATRLGLITAGANRAAVATRLLGVAMRAIPFVAIAAGLTGVIRLFRESRETLERFEVTIENLKGSMDGLENALEVFGRGVSLESAEGLKRAAETNITFIEETIAELEKAAGRVRFVPGLGDEFRELNALIEIYRGELVETQAVLSAAEARIEAFNAAAGGSADELRKLAQVQGQVGEATFASIPPLDEIREKYGEISDTVKDTLDLTNELALANGRIKFGNLIAESSEFLDNSQLTADEVVRLNQEFIDLRNTDAMGLAAEKALALARGIVTAAGGVDNLDDNTRLAVEKLTAAASQAAEVDANMREAERSAAGVGDAAQRAAEQFRQMANATRGGMDFRLPDNNELVSQYGRLSSLAREQLQLQQQIAQIEARRNLSAVVKEAAQLTGSLRLNVQEQARFNQLLNQAATAQGFGQAARGAQELQQFVIQAAGGVQNLSDETRTLVLGLSEVALANAQWAETADQATRTTAGGIRFIKANLRETADASTDTARTIASNFETVGASLSSAEVAIEQTTDVAKANAGEIANVADTARSAAKAVSDEAGAALGQVQERVGQARAEIEQVQGETQKVVIATQEAIDASNALLQEFITTAQELGAQAISALADGMSSRSGEPTNQARLIVQQVQSAFTGLRNDLFNSGARAMDGFIQGIRSREATAIAQAQATANRVTAATKDAFQIRSPSRVFLEIGANIIDAIIQALDNGADAAGSKAAQIAQLIVQLFQENIGTLVVPVEGQVTGISGTGSGGGTRSVLSSGGGGGTRSVLSGTTPRPPLSVVSSGTGGRTYTSSLGGGWSTFADGGWVSGQGGPRDDKIRAMVSNGEFITNARAAAGYGPVLEAINANRGDQFMQSVYSRAYSEGAREAEMNALMTLRGANTSPAAGRPVNLTQNFNFPGGDADSFRRSESQIRARTERALREANDRNN
jgi:TP901 family phage tail tape measure protein